MKLILLSGNSLQNKEWIYDIAKTLKPLFEETYVHDYKHWRDGGGVIDMNYEIEELIKKIRTWHSNDYAVFAKSAGTLLTLRGIFEKKLRTSKCIFVGTPPVWGTSNGFDVDTWLQGYKVPTLFIQKTKDPASSFEDLKTLLEEKHVQNHTLAELEGDTHHYEDLQKIFELVKSFL